MAMVFHFAPKVRTAVEGRKRTQAGLIVVVKDSLSYCRNPVNYCSVHLPSHLGGEFPCRLSKLTDTNRPFIGIRYAMGDLDPAFFAVYSALKI